MRCLEVPYVVCAREGEERIGKCVRCGGAARCDKGMDGSSKVVRYWENAL